MSDKRNVGWALETSPYHPGETAVQERAGARAFAERMGRQVIRDHMTDQHRTFFAMLPYAFIGSLDGRGRSWASVLSGKPGFLKSPNPRRLVVSALPPVGDPAREGLRFGAPVGFVGVELHTRRRNRLTGRIVTRDGCGFEIAVDQSFGNCPQYIQARAPEAAAPEANALPTRELGSRLNAVATRIVERSDTLFIATASPNAGSDDPVEGADVNHRGGRPGFVRVGSDSSGSVLTFPDFVGNLAFNTLGNIALNPQAGLLFLDFETGDLVTLTGTAEVIWDGAELRSFAGAERLVRVRVDEAWHLPSALPCRWTRATEAPQLLGTGDWRTVAAAVRARAGDAVDRRFRVTKLRDETPTVRVLDLEPVDSGPLQPYEPGQFLPVAVDLPDGQRLRRTYSLAQTSAGRTYRIGVRHERDGVVSAFLNAAQVGTEIVAQAPRGRFTLDPASHRSVVLIGGGIGVTPLVAMAEHLTGGTESRSRYPDRRVFVVHAVTNGADHPFGDRLRALAQSRANLVCVFAYSAPRPEDRPGDAFHVTGRLDRAVLRSLLPLDDYDIYLCGPPGFMQAVYGALLSLGVADERIRAEAFGPASLRRIAQEPVEPVSAPAAAYPEANVAFANSGKTARWQAGTLLDLAEATGVEAPWSCRSGRCGTCAATLLSGTVTYPNRPELEPVPGTALICRAQPAGPSVVLAL